MGDSGGLSTRMDRTVSAILPKIAATIAERVSKGPPKINLATAENWVLRPELVVLFSNAVAENLTQDHLSYPQGFGGDPPLLNALAAFFNSYFHPFIPVLPSHIVATPGASNCLDTLFYNICDAGDSIFVPTPYWNGFDVHLTLRAGVKIIPVPTSTPAQCATGALLPALAEAYARAPDPARVKALLFTNPQNPLAQCYSKDTIRACMRFCQERGLHFVSDEAYAMSGFDGEDGAGEPFVSALAVEQGDASSGGKGGEEEGEKAIDPSTVHVVWTLSKDFGSSGVKMACLISQSNPHLRTGVALLTTTQISSLAAILATSLLSSPKLPSLLALNAQRLAESYNLTISVFRKFNVEYIPAYAGLFVFARLVAGAKSWRDEETALAELKTKGVLVAAGKEFHLPDGEYGWVRVNFAVERVALMEGLEIMKGWLRGMMAGGGEINATGSVELPKENEH